MSGEERTYDNRCYIRAPYSKVLWYNKCGVLCLCSSLEMSSFFTSPDTPGQPSVALAALLYRPQRPALWHDFAARLPPPLPAPSPGYRLWTATSKSATTLFSSTSADFFRPPLSFQLIYLIPASLQEKRKPVVTTRGISVQTSIHSSHHPSIHPSYVHPTTIQLLILLSICSWWIKHPLFLSCIFHPPLYLFVFLHILFLNALSRLFCYSHKLVLTHNSQGHLHVVSSFLPSIHPSIPPSIHPSVPCIHPSSCHFPPTCQSAALTGLHISYRNSLRICPFSRISYFTSSYLQQRRSHSNQRRV
jgi:hypothetical protein